MIPERIDSLCKLVIGSNEIIIITIIYIYFQVWNNIDEKNFKNFCDSLIFWNYFLWNNFLLTFLGDTFFFNISVILDFGFTLSVKNGFTVFQKVLLPGMSLVLILQKKFFFSILIKLTRRLRCLLYAFWSKSLFLFKNSFLRRDFFMICLLIFLFMKDTWFAQIYYFFMWACLWIS